MSKVTKHRDWNIYNIKNLVEYFIKNDLTMCAIESCTGGVIASSITSVDGASKILKFSTIAYSSEAKNKVFGVPSKLVTDKKIVSENTSIKMNLGLRNLCKMFGLVPAKLYISVTGWIGSNPNKDGNYAYFTLCYGTQIKTFKIIINIGINKKEKKKLLVKRIFLEVKDFVFSSI